MSEEERKRYFGALVEQLYGHLQAVSEGTAPNKGDIATQIIWNFYNDYKDDYKLTHIEDVMKELERVDRDMKRSRGEKEIDEK